jgi:hypothetical protein
MHVVQVMGEMSDSSSADLRGHLLLRRNWLGSCRSVVGDPDMGEPSVQAPAGVAGDRGDVGLFECRPTGALIAATKLVWGLAGRWSKTLTWMGPAFRPIQVVQVIGEMSDSSSADLRGIDCCNETGWVLVGRWSKTPTWVGHGLRPMHVVQVMGEMSDSSSADLRGHLLLRRNWLGSCRSVVEDPDMGGPRAQAHACGAGDGGNVGLFDYRPAGHFSKVKRMDRRATLV